MHMSIIISLLDRSDWRSYKTIQLEALRIDQQAFGSSYKDWAIASDEKWQERAFNSGTKIVLARDGNRPIGLVGYHVKDNSEEAHLWGMFVATEYRRKGIGKKLLEKIIELAKKIPNVKKISLDVNPEQVSAIELYKSIGFTETGKRNYLMGDGVERQLATMSILR